VEYEHQFNEADMATLRGPWKWLGKVAGAGMDAGPGGLIDDDLAYVNPWGCDPRDIKAPVLLLHGDADGIIPSSHGEWLAAHCPTAELRLAVGAGHISVLDGARSAIDWLVASTTLLVYSRLLSVLMFVGWVVGWVGLWGILLGRSFCRSRPW
jgi:pimeloyl-ACP methyl ester carboxylesterase